MNKMGWEVLNSRAYTKNVYGPETLILPTCFTYIVAPAFFFP